jgi:CheY-like chemotaxis protein
MTSPSHSPVSRRARLLIVEDEADLRSMVEDLLTMEGYEVWTAENGLDALILLERQGPPDLVLLDLSMPVMSGYEFLEHLRRREPIKHVPVLVVSALAYRVTSNVAGVVPKPIDAWLLLEKVRQVLGSDETQAH